MKKILQAVKILFRLMCNLNIDLLQGFKNSKIYYYYYYYYYYK